MNWKEALLEYYTTNRGRIHGMLCGLAFGILSLTVGFWRTAFLTLCICLGYWLGNRRDSVSQFIMMLDRFLPKIMR